MSAEQEIDRLWPEPGSTTVSNQLSGYMPTEKPYENRPYVAMNFALTIDGRAAIAGRSGAIGSKVDSALLMRLRTRFDAVMIGAGTMRAERYGRIVPDPQLRAWRERVGLPHDPLAVIVSAGLDLPWDAPLFTSSGRVLILTNSGAKAPPTEVRLRTEQLPAIERPDGERGVDMVEVLRYLRHERGIRALLCEGGPHLHAQLQAAGAVDELFVTVGPQLIGGDAPRLTEGPLFGPREAELAWLLRHGSELLARYTFEPPN